jgi:hypothetical protein
MNERPTDPLAVAETHAADCFAVLNRHFENSPRCGCRIDTSGGFPCYVVAPGCLLGANACEEYDLATDRVLELKALSPTTPR